MIDGWDSFVPNDHLMLKIAVTIAQIGDASVNGILGGKGCTEFDSHDNMCIVGKMIFTV